MGSVKEIDIVGPVLGSVKKLDILGPDIQYKLVMLQNKSCQLHCGNLMFIKKSIKILSYFVYSLIYKHYYSEVQIFKGPLYYYTVCTVAFKYCIATVHE